MKYLETLIDLLKEKNKKAAINALEKLKTVFSESLKDQIATAKLFVVEEYLKEQDEDKFAAGFFGHKLKLLLEKFVKVASQ